MFKINDTAISILKINKEALFQYVIVTTPFVLWWALGYYIEVSSMNP